MNQYCTSLNMNELIEKPVDSWKWTWSNEDLRHVQRKNGKLKGVSNMLSEKMFK